MREIKFRAWDRTHNIMLYNVAPFYNPTVNDFRQHIFVIDLNNEEWTKSFDLMQYTGLKDKNGREIYEGDILKEDGFGLPIWVVWASGNFATVSMAGSHSNYIIADICEVVGNIYENGELLKGAGQ